MWARFASIVVAVSTIAALSERPRPRLRTSSEPVLPRIEMIRIAGAGHQSFFADVYWLAMIQALGAARTAEEYRDIYYYADFITDLDWKFDAIYRYAGVTLPFNRGRESWVNTDESTRILDKGLRYFPADPRLLSLKGYNLMYYDRNMEEAAVLFRKLGELTGKVHWFQLATRLFSETSRYDVATELARNMRDSATDDETRDYFERRIKEIELEQVLVQVDRAVADYQQQFGQLPRHVTELLATGRLLAIPLDPLGGRIFIDKQGRARSTSTKYRMELIEPGMKEEYEKNVEGEDRFEERDLGVTKP